MLVLTSKDLVDVINSDDIEVWKEAKYTSLALASYFNKEHFTINALIKKVIEDCEGGIRAEDIKLDHSVKRDPVTKRVSCYTELNYKGFLRIITNMNGSGPRKKSTAIFNTFMDLVDAKC